MTKVLIVEDDPIIGEMLTLYLTEEQFNTFRVDTAAEGLQAVSTYQPDMILLDLMLPDASGVELCAQFRVVTNLPLIVISMKNAVTDRIQAISNGADDYLSKPFSMQELKVRMNAILRRSSPPPVQPSPASAHDQTAATVQPPDIFVDLERRILLQHGEVIDTTFSEYEMMKLFTLNPGRVFTREELINSVRGIDSFINDRAIDVHITNLRRKIEKNPKEPRHIKTVWGVGYKFLN